MQVVNSYANGMFCWVDLTTTDPVSAKVFYAKLFGWEYEDRPTDMGTPYLEQEYSQALQTRAAEYEDRPTDMGIPYTNCQIDGYRVAGLVLMPESMQGQNIPPRWTSYIKHDDVDAVAEKVTEAGGTVTMPPMDVMTEGRLLMAQDPAGADFCVWQPKNNTGAHLVNIPNTLVWNELQTRDAPGALRFYHSVFGWDHDADPSGYHLFKVNEHVHAGMLLIDDSWGDVPPHWTPYFMVADIEVTVATVQELGGTILVPVTAIEEMGRFSVIQDPQGGVFVALQFHDSADPPRKQTM